MRCGNDPNVSLTSGDQAVVDWFRAYLAWSKLPAEEKTQTPEPVRPGGTKLSDEEH